MPRCHPSKHDRSLRASASGTSLSPSLSGSERTPFSGFFSIFACPNQVAFVCLLVLGSAVILELLQIIIRDRDARVVDALEKFAGGAAGILAARKILALSLVHRCRPFRSDREREIKDRR